MHKDMLEYTHKQNENVNIFKKAQYKEGIQGGKP